MTTTEALPIFEQTRRAVESGDLLSSPDGTCDESPPRHADTVPVPVVVHAREDEQARKAS